MIICWGRGAELENCTTREKLLIVEVFPKIYPNIWRQSSLIQWRFKKRKPIDSNLCWAQELLYFPTMSVVRKGSASRKAPWWQCCKNFQHRWWQHSSWLQWDILQRWVNCVEFTYRSLSTLRLGPDKSCKNISTLLNHVSSVIWLVSQGYRAATPYRRL